MGIALSAALCLLGPSLGSAATFTVNHTADSPDLAPGNGVCDTGGGRCTLRAAIQEANAAPDADDIAFAIPPLDG